MHSSKCVFLLALGTTREIAGNFKVGPSLPAPRMRLQRFNGETGEPQPASSCLCQAVALTDTLRPQRAKLREAKEEPVSAECSLNVAPKGSRSCDR